LSPRDFAAYVQQAQGIGDRLSDTIKRLRRAGVLPPRPSQMNQARMNRILTAARRGDFRPKVDLRLFWEALRLYQANYTCCYCGRSSRDVFHAEGKRRALRMVVDHVVPVPQGGKFYSFKNCEAACWSCNLLKSSIAKKAFLQELRSLAHAVVGNGMPSR
jgi:5-methylcytosine-specific restriction endonuclease McrA